MFLRYFNIISSSFLILFTAAGCTFPGIGSGSAPAATPDAGIIKLIGQDGKRQIGAVNFLEQTDYETGQTVTERGIAKISNGYLFPSRNKDEYYFVSPTQGIYYSQNSGQLWRRIYVFAIKSNKTTLEERTAERQAQLARNNSFKINSFLIDPTDSKVLYVSGLLGNIGKLYKSVDGGSNFIEKGTEVNENVTVTRVAVNPQNPLEVYEVLGNNVINKSIDGGDTWQKIKTFESGGPIVQFGFIEKFDNLFFILQEQGGILTSTDGGLTWQKINSKRLSNKIGEAQPQDALSFEALNSINFGSYERLIPVTPTKGEFLMLADRQLWITKDINKPWSKINLPLQEDQVQISSVAFDPENGTNKIYLTIQNKLFVSLNRGESWSTETLPVNNPILQIVVDNFDPKIMFMALGPVK